MTKARTLANFVSDGSTLADGAISVSEVSGAAPLASPTFTGTTTVSGDFNVFNDNGSSAIYDFKSDHYSQIQLTSDVDNSSLGGPYTVQIVANGNNGDLELRTNTVQYMSISQSGNVTFNEYSNDADFRVESDGKTHMLFVDAAQDKVGINESTPEYTLDVGGASTGSFIAARLHNKDTTTGSGVALNLQNSAFGGVNEGEIRYTNNGVNNNNNLSFHGEIAGVNGLVQLGAFEGGGGQWVTQRGAVFNESGINSDFRVESNSNANMLLVDAGNNSVGIGTGSPVASGATTVTIGTRTIVGKTIENQSLFSDNAYFTGANWTTKETDSWAAIRTNTNSIRFHTGGTHTAGTNLTAMDSSSMRLYISDTETVFNDVSTDTDFRVESDGNANALFVDAAQSAVGINTNSTFQELTVNGNIAVGGAGNKGIYFGDNITSSLDQEWLLANNASSSNAFTLYEYDSGTYVNTRMLFISGGGTNFYNANNSTFTINQDGNDSDFRVESNDNTHMLFVDAGQNAVTINGSTVAGDATYKYPLSVRANTAADAIAVVGRTNDDIGELGFYESDGTTQLGNVQARPSDGGMRFRSLPTSATMHFDLTDSSGNLQNRMLFQEAELRINDPGDDYDFRVESDSNANMLKVDAGADQVVVGSSSTTLNHALRVAGSVGGFGGDVADTASGSSRTLDMPISELGGGRGTYMVSYFAYANGGDRQAGFMCMLNVMTSPDRAAGSVISERYATVTSITHSGANVRIVFTATGGYTHQGGKISILKLA